MQEYYAKWTETVKVTHMVKVEASSEDEAREKIINEHYGEDENEDLYSEDIERIPINKEDIKVLRFRRK